MEVVQRQSQLCQVELDIFFSEHDLREGKKIEAGQHDGEGEGGGERNAIGGDV